MTPVSRVAVAVAAISLSRPSLARAQSAGAEALFREGRTLIKAGKLDAGCDKLEASEKLESSVGTLLNLGDCREKQGRTATAWAAFRKAEAMAKRAGGDRKRQAEAARRAEKLEGGLATLTIQVGAKSKAVGLVIKRDGEELDPAVWGTAVVVDPGSHTIVAEAPGARPWKSEVSIGKGGKRWVVVPTLEREPEPVTPPPPAAPSVAVTPAPITQRTTVVTHTWGPTRGAATALGLAGLGAVGVGAYFGQRSQDRESAANMICPDAICGDAGALQLNNDAQTDARRATILFVAGGAAVLTATVLWLVGKPDAETIVAPSASPDHVGATVSRRF